jgi:hypothetical protein
MNLKHDDLVSAVALVVDAGDAGDALLAPDDDDTDALPAPDDGEGAVRGEQTDADADGDTPADG